MKHTQNPPEPLSLFLYILFIACLVWVLCVLEAHADCTLTPNLSLCTRTDNTLFTRTNQNSLVNAVDAFATNLSSTGALLGSTVAALPAAGTAGRLRRVTDSTRSLWVDQGTQWFSLSGKVVNVQEFGATGNGTTDDTTAIQNAINAAGTSTTAGTVFFPQGRYKITATLTVTTQGLRLVGAAGHVDGSVSGSVLVAGGAISVLTIGQRTPTIFVNGVTIENLSFDGVNKTGTTALTLINVHNSRFTNLTILSFSGTQLDIQDEIFNVLFDSAYITDGGGIGVRTRLVGSAAIQKLYFTNLRARNHTGDNVSLETGATIIFVGGEIEAGAARGLGVTNSVSALSITGTHFENNTTADIDFYKASPSSATFAALGAVIDDGFFYGASLKPYGIQAKGAQNVTIHGGYFNAHTTGGINFDNAGLTGALNTNNAIINPYLNESVAGFVKTDGVTFIENTGAVSVGGAVSPPPVGTLFARNTAAGAATVLGIENRTAAGADVGGDITILGDTAGVIIGQLRTAFTAASNADSYMAIRTRQAGSVVEVARFTAGNVGVGITTNINERLTLPNAGYVGGVNAAGNASKKLIGLNASDQVSIAGDGSASLFGGAVSVGGAVSPPPVGTLFARNTAAGAATVLGIENRTAAGADVGGDITILGDTAGVIIGQLRTAFTAASNADSYMAIRTRQASSVVEVARFTAGNVGIGTATPAASALLDLTSTTGAFLPPRMTTVQRDALTAVDGMLVYNTTTGALNYRKAGVWTAI